MSLRNCLTQVLDWKVLIRIPILAYLTLAGYGYFFTDRQIFIPQYAANPPLPSEPIVAPVTNDESITLVYLSDPQAKYTILYSHGNAETLGSIYPYLLQLKNLGFNILAYDYRGYGKSSGQATEQNSYQDILTAYKYATQKLNIATDRLIIFGRSIGGGPSTYLASQKPVAGLILESTFTSIFRVPIPFPILPFDKFPNKDRLKQVNAPVLIIHGDRDEIIPFSHGQALFQAAKEPKQFLEIPGAGHNDLSEIGGKLYEAKIQEFAQHLDRKP